MSDINRLNQINKFIYENGSLFEANRQLRIKLTDAMARIAELEAELKQSLEPLPRK